jgi:FdhD protein
MVARSEEPVVRAQVWRWGEGALARGEAHLIVEEALEIHVDGAPYAVVMRTPGDDRSLAAGFCLAEGLVDSAEELGAIAVARSPKATAMAAGGLATCEAEEANRVSVVRAGRRAGEGTPSRAPRLAVGSSCGLCGREMIEDIMRQVPPLTRQVSMSPAGLLALGKRMQEAQRYFRLTGGTHAAAVFSASGEMLSSGEDIGRHNALDKAIGRLLVEGGLEKACAVALSGRCSFEMVQKAARAGIPVAASVSAPTDLAVALAGRLGMTLVGFLRAESFTIYLNGGRIAGAQHR